MAFIHGLLPTTNGTRPAYTRLRGLMCATMNDVSHVTSAESNHMAPHVVSSSTAPRLAIALRTSLRTAAQTRSGALGARSFVASDGAMQSLWAGAEGIVTREAEAKFKRSASAGQEAGPRRRRGAGEGRAGSTGDRGETDGTIEGAGGRLHAGQGARWKRTGFEGTAPRLTTRRQSTPECSRPRRERRSS